MAVSGLMSATIVRNAWSSSWMMDNSTWISVTVAIQRCCRCSNTCLYYSSSYHCDDCFLCACSPRWFRWNTDQMMVTFVAISMFYYCQCDCDRNSAVFVVHHLENVEWEWLHRQWAKVHKKYHTMQLMKLLRGLARVWIVHFRFLDIILFLTICINHWCWRRYSLIITQCIMMALWL